jgi:uncharacterized membrane protein YjjP (DUF1212 family)
MEGGQVAASEAAANDVMSGDPPAELVIALGRAFHEAGVPTDELEAIMHETAQALSLELQVTALPTSITAAIGPGSAQKIVLLRLEPGIIDLRRLALLNLLYTRVLERARSGAPDERSVTIREALAEVERIRSLRHSVGALQSIAAYCLLSLGASILLGGHAQENAAAAGVGAATGVLGALGARLKAVDRTFNVLAAFLATVVVALYSEHVHPLRGYVPIVAGVVQVLPGLQLTQALRELAFRNLVAGTARLGAVLIALLSLGCGFALGVAVVGPRGFHMATLGFESTPWYELAFAVLAVALSISTLENARLRDIPWVCAACGISELAYRGFAALPGHAVAAFGGALVVGLMAAAGARFARVPQAVLLVPGLLILVPGSLSYESILELLSNASGAAAVGLNAVVAAIEIVSGLLLAQLIVAPNR